MKLTKDTRASVLELEVLVGKLKGQLSKVE